MIFDLDIPDEKDTRILKRAVLLAHFFNFLLWGLIGVLLIILR